MSSNYEFQPTLDGLNNIESNTINTENLVVESIAISTSGTAPTLPNPLDYSNNIATTEWVTNHAGIGYVTINTSQTLTSGIKTFQNLPECPATATTNNQLVNLNTLTNAISTASVDYVHITGTETITGEKTFSNTNTYINNTLTANTITATGDLTLNPVGSINCNGKTIDMTGGEIHKCPLIHSQNNNNIVVEALGTGDIILKTNGINRVTVADNGITTFSSLPECPATATTNDQLVNLNTLTNAISTAVSGAFVTLAGAPQLITGDKSFNGSIDFLSLEASLISNTGGIDTPNIGSGLATDPISIVPSQSSGTCNIATFATRTGSINIGTGTSAKTMTIGGTATTTNIDSLRTTFSTSSTSGNSITHSSTATSGDDLRLTASGGYIARIGEGSSSDGLTIMGVDSGTSIIKATTSALEIRADAGLTFTGTIGSNNTFSGTNTLNGITQFNNNLRVASTSTLRLGTASTGTLIGQTYTNEVTAQNINASDKFIFRTSTGLDIMSLADSGILVSSATSFTGAVNVNQGTYASFGTTQLGYTIQVQFGSTVLSDTTGTYSQVGSQALGTHRGVYLITCGFELTNSGADTVNNKALCLSLSTASGTPVNGYGGWKYYEEINDTMGGGGTRFQGSLCGVYTKTTTSAETLYLNGFSNTSGSQTMSAIGYCSITRIG